MPVSHSPWIPSHPVLKPKVYICPSVFRIIPVTLQDISDSPMATVTKSNLFSIIELSYFVLFDNIGSQHPLCSQYLWPSWSLSHACMYTNMHALLDCDGQMMKVSSHTTSRAKPCKPKDCPYFPLCAITASRLPDGPMSTESWQRSEASVCWACLFLEFWFTVPFARDRHI